MHAAHEVQVPVALLLHEAQHCLHMRILQVLLPAGGIGDHRVNGPPSQQGGFQHERRDTDL